MLTYQISPWIFFLFGVAILPQVIELTKLFADGRYSLEERDRRDFVGRRLIFKRIYTTK